MPSHNELAAVGVEHQGLGPGEGEPAPPARFGQGVLADDGLQAPALAAHGQQVLGPEVLHRVHPPAHGAGPVVGVVVAAPTINMPAFVGFTVDGKSLFPILFITIACGAVSGFHSLVSSGTSSKAIASESDMLPVGYGAMLVECMLGVVALVIACAAASNGALPAGTPFQIFA